MPEACQQWRNRLLALVDGELAEPGADAALADAAGRAELDAHLATCSPCTAELAALQRSMAATGALWGGYLASIEAAGAEQHAAAANPAAVDLVRSAPTRPAGRPTIQRLKPTRRTRWAMATLAVAAASALLALWPDPSTPGHRAMPDAAPQGSGRVASSEAAELEALRLAVLREGVAQQLVAAADLLAEQPQGVALACERYAYVTTAYANSAAARVARQRLAEHCRERGS